MDSLAPILEISPTIVQTQHNTDKGQDGRDQQPAKSLKVSKSGYRHEKRIVWKTRKAPVVALKGTYRESYRLVDAQFMHNFIGKGWNGTGDGGVGRRMPRFSHWIIFHVGLRGSTKFIVKPTSSHILTQSVIKKKPRKQEWS